MIDNLSAAERFGEMIDGNYSGYPPYQQSDFNFGQFLFKTGRNILNGGKGNGSKNAGFVAKWGALGDLNFEQGVSWAEWKRKNCDCQK